MSILKHGSQALTHTSGVPMGERHTHLQATTQTHSHTCWATLPPQLPSPLSAPSSPTPELLLHGWYNLVSMSTFRSNFRVKHSLLGS